MLASTATHGMPYGGGPAAGSGLQQVHGEIIGKVHTTGDIGPAALQVAVFANAASIPHESGAVKDLGADGIFSLPAGIELPFILEVRGPGGQGRVYVTSFVPDDTLRISYPVVEEIVFLHTNDHHFDINLLDKFTETVSEIRGRYPDVFLFDAGDIFVRHPHRWVENDVPRNDVNWYADRALRMVQVMNDLKYDALTLGNHEFDYVEYHTANALQEAEFPILSANVQVSTMHLPDPESFAWYQTRTGRSIAVLGLSVVSGNKEGVRQMDILETAADYMFLRDESDVLVALTHIGLEHDVSLAEEFPQIDVIIGGHSHHLIEEAVLVNGVLIAQAGGNQHVVSDLHPVYLGMVLVRLENGRVTEKTGHVVLLSDMAP